MTRLPVPRYPDGWFQVAWSDEIAVGEVRRLSGFGKELVAFRGKSGSLCVLDAYCPHLGAHLGVGGTVDGDTIQCPFHGWRFDGNGVCVDVPYAKRIARTTTAGLTRWPVVERNGLVMVWHDTAGNPPQWEIPELAEYENDAWTAYCRLRWKVRTNNQALAENAVERAHVRHAHGAFGAEASQLVIDGPVLGVRHTATIATPRGPMEGLVASRSFGLGFVETRFRGPIETLLVASVLPIDANDVDIRCSFTLRKLDDADSTRVMARALVANIEKQVNEQKPIWENDKPIRENDKAIRENEAIRGNRHEPARPLLCDDDGPMAQFRRWSEQFYTWPENDAPSVAAR